MVSEKAHSFFSVVFGNLSFIVLIDQRSGNEPIWFPESSFGKRELWEQTFQACDIDADCTVKSDGQNSVISIVILEWLFPELSFSGRWSRGTKSLGTRLETSGERAVKLRMRNSQTRKSSRWCFTSAPLNCF